MPGNISGRTALLSNGLPPFGSCCPIDFVANLFYQESMLRFFSFLMSVALASAFAAEEHATFKAGAYTFAKPEKWTWTEGAEGMRAAQLKIPDEKGTAEVVFFVFPGGGGGSAQANADRWLGMFQEGKDKINSKVETVKKDKGTITFVRAEGTYMSGMPGGAKTPMPNSMLQGAIIEGEQGNVYARMTGPIAVVKANTDKFKKMVEDGVK
jgi:hypothetical protein